VSFSVQHPKEKGNALSIIEKIKILRNHREVSQQSIAEYALMSQKKISRIENGEDEYDDIELKAVKEYFDIVGMPLTEIECTEFRSRLYYWRNLIRDRRMDEATALRDELEKIVNLDVFYFDLPTLYRIFEVLFLLTEISLSTETTKDFSVVEEKLKHLEGVFDEMNAEHCYYYNFQLGVFYILQNDLEKALEYYNLALDIKKQHKNILPNDEDRLYYNLALCYTDLEQPSRALSFLNKVPKAYFENTTSRNSLSLNIILAKNYYKIGLYNEAEEILNDCLLWANGMNDKLYIGLSLHHLGVVCKYSNNWGKAIDCFDQTLNTFGEDIQYARYHAWALYFKFRCRMELGELAKIERELRDLKLSLAKRKNDEYTEFLETISTTLKHIVRTKRSMSRYDRNAVEYLENVSAPFFEKYNCRLEALECHKLLKQHFIKTSQQKKTLQASEAMLAIYERMI